MTCGERILSNDYADILVDYELPEEYGYAPDTDYCYHSLGNGQGILYIERTDRLSSERLARLYSHIPKCYGLMECRAAQAAGLNTFGLSESGILRVQNEPLNLKGENVTIGFIDTGIRYQEEAFRDYAGRSRIEAIWDQTVQTGNPPEGFGYGSEFTNAMINEALSSDNPLALVPSAEANGHGSVMAAVAAGSPIANGSFIGAAPESRIAVVKLKEAKQYLKDYYNIPLSVPCYSEADILQAIQYLQKYAEIFKRPLVICLGIGTSLGDHAGNSSLDNYIDYWGQKRSRVFVVAGGNEGNAAHHYHGSIEKGQSYRDVEIRVGEGERGFIADLWGDAPYFYDTLIRSPGGESVRWSNSKSGVPQEFSFIYEKTRILIEYQLVETLSGAELIRFRFVEPTAGVWTLRVSSAGSSVGGSFDIWLPVTDFLTAGTYFLEPSPQTTITEPAYAKSAVSVSAYQGANNSIAASSGRGYARDGYIVPAIAAPGVGVSTPFGERSGSSVAAAITAGGCAQLLEWAVVRQNDVMVNSVSIKNYLIRGAAREAYLEYPNREWGYGRLDIAGVFDFLAAI